jgi:hypothetical protein
MGILYKYGRTRPNEAIDMRLRGNSVFEHFLKWLQC